MGVKRFYNFTTTNNISVAPFPGCRRYTVLHWGLRFHNVWWLWSFFWGYLHFHPSHGDNCCGHASFCHWFHWMLCHHSRKPLWPGHGKLESSTPNFHIYSFDDFSLRIFPDCSCLIFLQFSAVLLLVFATEVVVVVLGYIYRAKVGNN